MTEAWESLSKMATMGQFLLDTRRKIIEERLGVGIEALGRRAELGDSVIEASHLLGMAHDHSSLAGLSQDMIREVAVKLHAKARWAQLGFPTFQLTHGLAAALLLTEPKGLEPNDCRWPYPNFVLVMPHPKGPISIDCHDGIIREVRWVICHQFNSPEDQASVDLLQQSLPTMNSLSLAFDRKDVSAIKSLSDRLLNTDLTKVRFKMNCRVYGQTERDDVWHRGFAISEAPSVMDWMKSDDGPELTKRDRGAVKACMRLVANFSAFLKGIHSEGPTLSRPKSISRRDANGTIHPPVWLVGQTIKLSSELREAAAAQAAGERRKAEWHVKRRFVVRGHWRQQACGVGMKDRKAMWIAPHWKGPKDAAGALVRLYEAEGSDPE